MYIYAIPPLRLRARQSANPARPIIAKNASGEGNSPTEAGK